MAAGRGAEVVFVQRCVPHYRGPLFRALWERFGWLVAAASSFPETSHLKLVEGSPQYLRRYRFRFLDAKNPYRCIVPVSRILDELRPRAVIAELSLGMTSTWDLPVRRRIGNGPHVFFWSHGYNMERSLGFKGLLAQAPRVLPAVLADGHIVYSEEGRRVLSRVVEASRIVVVRNSLAVPVPAIESSPRDGASSRGGPALLSIGRMTPDKGFPSLVRVFKELRRDFPDATLTIIGEGPVEDETRREAGDLLGSAILMPGAIYDEDRLAEQFHGTGVAVFMGAVGLSVNHALLHGVPVVAFERSNRGPFHHPEIAYVVDGITGLRVRPYSEAAMLHALRGFLRDHPRPKQEFAGSIRRFVGENLDPEATLGDFSAVAEMIRRSLRSGS